MTMSYELRKRRTHRGWLMEDIDLDVVAAAASK